MGGLGYTFTSGATEAWAADEIGAERAGEAYLRGSKAAQMGALVAVPISVALGSAAINLPIVLGGASMIMLALLMSLAMTEKGFVPTPAGERTTRAMMRKTAGDACQLVRCRPVILPLLGVSLFYGLYSEGSDRLWTAHLLNRFAFPLAKAVKPVVWLGVIRAVLLVLGLVTTEIARRRVDARRSRPLARTLMFNAGLIIMGLAGFGLVRSFWLAVVLLGVVDVCRSVTAPLHTAWLKLQIDDSQVRATLFSVSSQVDALGQIAGGPAVGAIGNLSIRAALVASSVLLPPVLPLCVAAFRRYDGRSRLPEGAGLGQG